MNRELIILLKTNHYLRAIDVRLGNPTNTFTQVNDMTWKIYSKEASGKLSTWQYMRHAYAYYYLKVGLFFYYLAVQFKHMLGFKVSQEEMEDFELDFNEHV